MTNQFLPSYTIGTDAYDSVYNPLDRKSVV